MTKALSFHNNALVLCVNKRFFSCVKKHNRVLFLGVFILSWRFLQKKRSLESPFYLFFVIIVLSVGLIPRLTRSINLTLCSQTSVSGYDMKVKACFYVMF